MYNAKDSKEEAAIPEDTILQGIVINIDDGKVSDFVKSDKWQGNTSDPAINVNVEVKHNERTYQFSQVFTYREEDGTTKYGAKSNLGKYKKKYGKLPEVKDLVKAITNTEGFLRLKLD